GTSVSFLLCISVYLPSGHVIHVLASCSPCDGWADRLERLQTQERYDNKLETATMLGPKGASQGLKDGVIRVLPNGNSLAEVLSQLPYTAGHDAGLHASEQPMMSLGVEETLARPFSSCIISRSIFKHPMQFK
uniref:Uncharacterized protein n=1 Tax=Oryzias melastigma TaxID=30732 RepID=A0A3B3CH21_ORYME